MDLGCLNDLWFKGQGQKYLKSVYVACDTNIFRNEWFIFEPLIDDNGGFGLLVLWVKVQNFQDPEL